MDIFFSVAFYSDKICSNKKSVFRPGETVIAGTQTIHLYDNFQTKGEKNIGKQEKIIKHCEWKNVNETKVIPM